MTTGRTSTSLHYELVHYQQKYDWDCGLSCILMVLPLRKRAFMIEHFDRICDEQGFGESTWTIDLCYVLRKLDMPHVYLTSVLGVNSGFNRNKYYDNVLDKDEGRITRRFGKARQVGLTIRRHIISADEMIAHLADRGPIILLTNGALLSCHVCQANNKLSNELWSLFPVEVDYSGHYVVLCGFNRRIGRFLYRNPSKSDHICTIAFKQLDVARKSFGTDCDTILLFNKKKGCAC